MHDVFHYRERMRNIITLFWNIHRVCEYQRRFIQTKLMKVTHFFDNQSLIQMFYEWFQDLMADGSSMQSCYELINVSLAKVSDSSIFPRIFTQLYNVSFGLTVKYFSTYIYTSIYNYVVLFFCLIVSRFSIRSELVIF